MSLHCSSGESLAIVRMNKRSPDTVTAFAPASTGNVAVGFDILGHAISGVGDIVSVAHTKEPGIHIASVSGCVDDLPRDPAENAATRGLVGFCSKFGMTAGLKVGIVKGIPLGSGMGGSAASAVAGAMAANALFGNPLTLEELLSIAIEGEAAATGDVPVDNVAPSLFGGLVLVTGKKHPRITRIPVPKVVRSVVVHPHLKIETRQAREILKPSVEFKTAVEQMGRLAGFLAGCFSNDLELIRRSLADVLVEPQRKHLVPGFDNVKSAALDCGALGCSLSGSGPSVFAWCEEQRAQAVADAASAAFEEQGIATDCWVSPIEARGAHLIDSANAVRQHS